jgi:hypothetical protein
MVVIGRICVVSTQLRGVILFFAPHSYCLRLCTENGEEFDAVLIRAPGLVRRVDDDCNPIADREEVEIAGVYIY